ncbi:LysR family transcriptional regulator [Kiloniella litopenaei]|uniref:LysR family transcriptional regulator n=1 Tax=Kiloniella litopenaei TaxID=1549748 RepID=UPI003BAD5033
MSRLFNIDWNDVATFVTVAQTGNLSVASKSMHISQPTIGRRIARLEERIDLILFHKGPTGYDLTPAGKEILPTALKIIDEQFNFQREIKKTKEIMQPTLRIFSGEWMTPLIADILPEINKLAGKDLNVLLETGRQPTQDAILPNDIVIMNDPVDLNSFVLRRLGQAPYAVFGSQNYLDQHPESSKERRYEEGHWAIVNQLTQLGEAAVTNYEWGYPELGPNTTIYRSTSVLSMMTLLKQGKAMGFVPLFIGSKTKDLIQFSDEIQSLEHTYWLVYRSDSPYIDQVKKITAVLSEHLVDSLHIT